MLLEAISIKKMKILLSFYHIVLNQTTGFPQIKEAIKIDKTINFAFVIRHFLTSQYSSSGVIES